MSHPDSVLRRYWKQFLKVVGWGTFWSVIVFTLFIILILLGISGPLPDTDDLRKVENPIATEVFSADSVLLGRYFRQERSNISWGDIPPSLAQALIATEDERFYSHDGIDMPSLARVIVKSILLGQESAGGGSTITQQLVKNLYPRKNYLLLSLPTNKVREMIIARRLEKAFTKQEILTLYLNTVPFGENIFGIEAAAQRYFSKNTSQLTLTEAATLVGMLKATHLYNPRLFPERSLTRRNVVLSQMAKNEFLSPNELDSLIQLPTPLRYNKITHHEGPAPYFREFLRAALMEWTRNYESETGKAIDIYTDGLKVYTSIDSRLQQMAENAVKEQMAILQNRFIQHWSGSKPWDTSPDILTKAIHQSDRYRRLKAESYSEEEIEALMKKPVSMSIFTHEGDKEVVMSPLDSIKHHLMFLSTGFIAMDPNDGSIRAWVGGIDHHYFQYDHAKASTKRQAGSTFKPIVYAAAIEHGVNPCNFITAEKTTYSNLEGWTPGNSDEKYDMKFSMPGALAFSVNTVSVRILEKAGINRTIETAQRMGIESQLDPVPSLALGTSDVSMMEMVTAYSTFANDGMRVTPRYILSIIDRHGNILQGTDPSVEQRAISQRTAEAMLRMLQRVVDEGTASRLRNQFGITMPVGAKTGTTQSNTDGWFIAVTPKLVVGCWVGGDDPSIRFRSTTLGQGARTALPIVGEFLHQMQSEPALRTITRANFPTISAEARKLVDCELYKEDRNLFRILSGRKGKTKEFGEQETGFLKRLFGKKNKRRE